jgi:hypothetical protein
MSIWNCLLLAGRKPPREPGPRRVRLELETLESRLTPTVTYHGGALLPHVEAQALYLGSEWVSSAANTQLAHSLDGFVNSLVTGPYLDMLTTAGYNVGRGTASPGGFDPLKLQPASVLADASIQVDLQLAIRAGLVKAPDANRLYVIFVEPNIGVGFGDDLVSEDDFLGYHGAFTGHDAAGQAADIRYAVLPYPGGTSDNLAVPNVSTLQSLTVVASHEIVESITDPDVDYGALGWYDDTLNDEIADVVDLEFVTLNGYAVQRIADKDDQGMTPIGAAPLQPVSFELLTGGLLYEHTPAGWIFVRSNVASVSSQGIDDDGRAMVDVVLTNGAAYEYHDGGQWQALFSGVQSAQAGQGVSYVLLTDGRLYEYRDDTGTWGGLIASHIKAIDAGTDRLGVNMVDALTTTGLVYEYSDTSGAHVLCSEAAAISAGSGGATAVVLKSGRSYQYSETTGAWTWLADGVTQVALGTDPAGGTMVDLVLTGGTAREYRAGVGWKTLSTSVALVGKGRAGLSDVVFTNGNAYEHTASGWTGLTTGVRQAS